MTSAPAAHDPEPSRYFYPDDVQPLMQSLLGTLANLDFEHQRDLERLERSTMRAGLKRDIAAKLKSRHARQAPYVEHLRTLHTRRAAADRPDREPESNLARCA
jgi:hypothetical protein